MPTHSTRRLTPAFFRLLRALGVLDADLRHAIQTWLTGKPSTKAWTFPDWRHAVELLKLLESPDQREQLVGTADTEHWSRDDWHKAIVALNARLREPDLPPELSVCATQRQLRYLADQAKQFEERTERGIYRFLVDTAFPGWDNWRKDRFVESGTFATLSPQEADVAIRRLKQELKYQRRHAEEAAACGH